MPAERPLRDGRETGFHLIETMRWQPGEGLLRRDLHMARLERSAHALGFALDMTGVEHELLSLEAFDTPQRVRLALESDGRCTVEARPFMPLAEGTVWKLAIASTRLSSSDPLLRHKTSKRDVYDAARAEFAADEADEVLLLNEKDEVCEGTITSLFVGRDDGVLVTSPLACGLLAGVLRNDLLERGKAIEQVLGPEDLAGAVRLFVGNSLRGLIPASILQRDIA